MTEIAGHNFIDAADSAADHLATQKHKCARLLVNGCPTDVEVGAVMVHGGVSPATCDNRMPAVGRQTADLFLPPTSHQNSPESLLTQALKHASALGLLRLINGQPNHETLAK